MAVPQLRRVVLVATLSVVGFAGCSGGSAPGGGAGERNSLLVVSAAGVPNGTPLSTLHAIPVAGGTLDVQVALLSIATVVIEENTGESQGGDQDGQHDGENDDQNDGGESDAEDIVLHGPFSFDVASGEFVLDSVPVYPGFFRKADLSFSIDPAPPFDGHSIRITGIYDDVAGGSTPFRLQSAYAEDVQVPIAGGGLSVGANEVLPVVLTFDLASLLGDLDFATADVFDGEILIDAGHNADLIAAFEAALSDSVELEDDDDGENEDD